MSQTILSPDKVTLKLLLVNGLSKELSLDPKVTIESIKQSVFEDWPEGI